MGHHQMVQETCLPQTVTVSFTWRKMAQSMEQNMHLIEG